MNEEHCCSHQWAEIRLADYAPPAYEILSVHLTFDLGTETSRVTSRMAVRAQADGKDKAPFILDGRNVSLRSVRLDGEPLLVENLIVEDERLILGNLPESFVLEIDTEVNPAANTALEGLYASGGMLCTQCESEGFRRITYYPDRPDVLSTFTTTLIADRSLFPVLLSNGDLIDSGDAPDGRHFATWHDPFRKPSYLFALVAGNLACITDTFTTMSGRKVDLRIYVREADLPRTGFAMGALKRAMRWDEERFGREYDLDTFMIVAVDDFNAGAMENKGLNIFNSSCVLADGASATDDDFQGIERIVGHEYFHNWTGNRITCRDWFQLSLKEGLTIYRDEEFSADMSSRAVKRISDVRFLRTIQFAEDSGPLSHPVRPASYIEIGNFYTTTVYRKGAEVVRMQAALLGEADFRRGMDLYFDRHDGEAVTIEDFVACMEEAGGLDLSSFMRWYTQAGTPTVHAAGTFDPATRRYCLTLRQETPSTPGQPDKEPYFIPVALGLLDGRGRELHLRLVGEKTHAGTSRVLHLREREQTFVFEDIPEQPVPSLFRNFSAPVKVDYPYTFKELDLLLAHDTDPFNRWEAAQKLAVSLILGGAGGSGEPDAAGVSLFAEALAAVMADPAADPAFVAEVLILPGEDVLADMMPVADPDAIHAAREALRRSLAVLLEKDLLHLALSGSDEAYSPEDGRAGERRLRGAAMSYLAVLDNQEYADLFFRRFQSADNMTDTMAALAALNMRDTPERREALAEFHRRWQHNRQVVDKWFAIQAAAPLPDTAAEVVRLLQHPDFEITNPNRVRALVATFCMRNHHCFHDREGRGYRFLADMVLRLNGMNAQLAARLLPPLTRWRRYDLQRQNLMKKELEAILASPSLSRDVYEVVSKSLAVQERAVETVDGKSMDAFLRESPAASCAVPPPS